MGLKQKAKGAASGFCFIPRTVYQELRPKKSSSSKFCEVVQRRFPGEILRAGLIIRES
jgi:hypothetical protein